MNGEKVTIQCSNCEVYYSVYRNRYEREHYEHHFCSRNCWLTFLRKNRKPTGEIQRVKTKCQWCHARIITTHPHQKYCNRDCEDKFNSVGKRVLNVYGFDEFERLCKRGKDYSFKKREDKFNAYYGLKTQAQIEREKLDMEWLKQIA